MPPAKLNKELARAQIILNPHLFTRFKNRLKENGVSGEMFWMQINTINNTLSRKQIKRILKTGFRHSNEKRIISVKLKSLNTLNVKDLTNLTKSSSKSTSEMQCQCQLKIFDRFHKVDGHVCDSWNAGVCEIVTAHAGWKPSSRTWPTNETLRKTGIVRSKRNPNLPAETASKINWEISRQQLIQISKMRKQKGISTMNATFPLTDEKLEKWLRPYLNACTVGLMSKACGDVSFVCNCKYWEWLQRWMDSNFTEVQNDVFGRDWLDDDHSFFTFQQRCVSEELMSPGLLKR